MMTTIGNLQTKRFPTVFLLFLAMTAISTSAQDIVPIFPAQGENVSLSQLESAGFQWSSNLGDISFTLYMSSTALPQNFPTYPYIDVASGVKSPYIIKSSVIFDIYLQNADITWWATDPLSGKESAHITFRLGGGNDLHPSPTPLDWQTRPTPTPGPVGPPQNLQFVPSDTISYMEAKYDFTIQWDPPAYPEGGTFVYDILIEYPQTQIPVTIEKFGITETSVMPSYLKPEFTTMEGVYKVYIQARDEQNRSSAIVASQFTVIPYKTPTPTPVPLNPDLSRNDAANIHDLAIFVFAFGSKQSDANFNPRADYKPDGVIDAYDLMIFQDLYKKRNEPFPAPVWLTARVPNLVYQGGYPPCVPVGDPSVYDFSSGIEKTILLGTEDGQCALAALNDPGVYLTFSAVTGATDYEITIRSTSNPSAYMMWSSTSGKTDIPIRWTLTQSNDDLVVQVRAVRGGFHSMASDEIHFILP
ncbi:MAG: hypothetical protein AB1656_07030 [Candidatus Omnitrophota bacterium]